MKAFVRTFVGIAILGLPLLALLLTPQLMRSRAGSELLLVVGLVAVMGLLAGMVVLSPVASAWLAPREPDWTPGTAMATAKHVWREHRRGAWAALLVLVACYLVSQVLAYGFAELVPYVSDNPAFVDGGDHPRWVIHYGPYAAQAAIIYLTICVGVAWYAARLRALAVGVSTTNAVGVSTTNDTGR